MKTVHVATIIWLICIASFIFGAKIAFGEELPQELSVKTVTGEVTLTIKPCKVDNNHGFVYEAYATDGDVTHNGCWFKDHDIVNILFYDEPVKLVATFKDYLFKTKK